MNTWVTAAACIATWASVPPDALAQSGSAREVQVVGDFPGRFVSWTDPRERAFTIEVPSGWQVTGGTQRISAIDVIQFVEVASADRAVVVYIGRPPVGMRTSPPMPQWEGKHSSEIPGYNLPVPQYYEYYKPAPIFLKELLPKLTEYCNIPQITSSNAYPQQAKEISATLTKAYGNTVALRADIADLSADCAGNRKLFLIADTLSISAVGVANWIVPDMYGLSTTPIRMTEAFQILDRMSASFRMDPNWVARQNNISVDVARQNADLSAHQSRILSETFSNRAHAQDRAMKAQSQYMRGTVTIENPNTHETVDVENKGKYFWRDTAHDRFMTTDTDTPPGIGFEAWRPVPTR